MICAHGHTKRVVGCVSCVLLFDRPRPAEKIGESLGLSENLLVAPGTVVNVHGRPGCRRTAHLRIKAGPQRDRYVHELVAEAMLGRELLPGEQVDHEDGDTLNNDWRNLKVRMIDEHARVGNERRRAE